MQRYESIAQMVLPIGSLEAEHTGYKCRSRRHLIGVPTLRQFLDTRPGIHVPDFNS
jgi:hypothetical protein